MAAIQVGDGARVEIDGVLPAEGVMEVHPVASLTRAASGQRGVG
jgi:hypothetical protein